MLGFYEEENVAKEYFSYDKIPDSRVYIVRHPTEKCMDRQQHPLCSY